MKWKRAKADTVSLAVANEALACEIDALDKDWPDWRTIVGQVDTRKQAPDPNNAYRKWLATKDPAYQILINATNSAAVISRSIRTFHDETALAEKMVH